MYKELFAFLSKRGKIDVCISSLFFTLYGLSSVGMLLTVFSILFKIAAGTDVQGLYGAFATLIGLVVFKGLCNMIADLKKARSRLGCGKANTGADDCKAEAV